MDEEAKGTAEEEEAQNKLKSITFADQLEEGFQEDDPLPDVEPVCVRAGRHSPRLEHRSSPSVPLSPSFAHSTALDGDSEMTERSHPGVKAGRRSPHGQDHPSHPKKGRKGVSFKSSTRQGWPDDVDYTHTPDMSAISPADKRMLRVDYVPDVEIRRITDPSHPACGENGLFATAKRSVGDILGEYTGKVVAGDQGGEYVTRLFDTGSNADYFRPGVDAEKLGNELRMINDYRNVPGAQGPNCRFARAALRGFRAALIVVIKQVDVEEEFLLDYGEQYWKPTPVEVPAESGEDHSVEERGISKIMPEDLQALEDDLLEMVAQAQDG